MSMSVSTNQILVFLLCTVIDLYSSAHVIVYAILYKQYELRYPFIGEFAGPVEHQSLINVGHHFLLIGSDSSIMSSAAFSGGLTGLTEGAAAEGHEN
jgi:uncharacterized SAM-binding protein YcdF (DUF218 family)